MEQRRPFKEKSSKKHLHNYEQKSPFCAVCSSHNHTLATCPLKHKILCRNYFFNDCHFGKKCLKRHDFPSHKLMEANLQSLINTTIDSTHYVDFRCVICRKRIVSAKSISRIFKNAVWTLGDCTTENTYFDIEEDFNIHKDTSSHLLRCSSCHNHIGWYFPNYRDQGITKTKLVYIQWKDGKNWMTVHASDRDVNEALRQHKPLIGGEEGYASLEKVALWPRMESNVTKDRTEKRLLQSLGEKESQEVISHLSKKMGDLGIRSQVENEHLKKDLKKVKKELEVAKEEKEDAIKCQVCFVNQRDILIEPCMHVCCCSTCATKLPACPICRGPINKVQKIFVN